MNLRPLWIKLTIQWQSCWNLHTAEARRSGTEQRRGGLALEGWKLKSNWLMSCICFLGICYKPQSACKPVSLLALIERNDWGKGKCFDVGWSEYCVKSLILMQVGCSLKIRNKSPSLLKSDFTSKGNCSQQFSYPRALGIFILSSIF